MLYMFIYIAVYITYICVFLKSIKTATTISMQVLHRALHNMRTWRAHMAKHPHTLGH